MRDLVISAFSIIGTISIWYDFLIYNVIAIMIFPSSVLKLALLSSVTTVLVGFLARPLGAFMFGVVGDVFSSKSSLSLTLALMGLSTLLISVIRSSPWVFYELTTLRFIQGLSLGGEWAGAVLLTSTVTNARSYGKVLTSLIQMGVPLGLILSSILLINWRLDLMVGALMSLVSSLIIFLLSPGGKASVKFKITLRDLRDVLRGVGAKIGESTNFYVYTSILFVFFSIMETRNLVLLSSIALALFTWVSSVMIIRIKPGDLMAYGYVIFIIIDALLIIRIDPLIQYVLFGIADALAYVPQSLFIPSILRHGIKHTGSGVAYQLASLLGGIITYASSAAIVLLGAYYGLAITEVLLIASSMVSLIIVRSSKSY